MFSLFRRHAVAAKSARRTPRSIRPCLEALEDRLTPSTGGALDPTFGSGGIVTTSFTNNVDEANAVATQPDGKIVVAGYTAYLPRGIIVTPYDIMEVARYNANGSLDTSFGTGGRVTTDFNKAPAVAYAVALQPQADGTDKILAAGLVQKNSGRTTVSDFGLVRYNANGSLDTSFGTGGTVETDLGSSDEYATSMVLQPDGKIVLAGYTNTSTGIMAALVRYNANGSLDTSFGSGGKLITAIKSQFDTGVAVQTQPDGSFKLVIAGTTPVTVGSTTNYDLYAARFNANGTLDTGFGTGGEVITPLLGKSDNYGGLAVQPDGKIIVAGTDALGSVGGHLDESLLVVRFTANGAVDTSFGSSGNGTVVVSHPAGYIGWQTSGVVVQADGQIVVGGELNPGGDWGFGMMRLNGDNSPNGSAGTVDSGYGTAGWTYAQALYVDAIPIRHSQTVALEPDGTAVIVGMAEATNGHGPFDFAVLRFLESAPQVGSFTANPNPAPAGSSVTLSASNISDGNPSSTIAQVAFYLDSNNDGTLEPGTDTLLGYAIQTSPGVWTLTFSTSAMGLTAGNYTLFAQAEDSYGAFGDAASLDLQLS